MISPELEVLDQLSGGDLPLNVIAGLFVEPVHCRTAVAAMLSDGQVQILTPDGIAIPAWKYRELEHEPDFWGSSTTYRLSITERGAKRIG